MVKKLKGKSKTKAGSKTKAVSKSGRASSSASQKVIINVGGKGGGGSKGGRQRAPVRQQQPIQQAQYQGPTGYDFAQLKNDILTNVGSKITEFAGNKVGDVLGLNTSTSNTNTNYDIAGLITAGSIAAKTGYDIYKDYSEGERLQRQHKVANVPIPVALPVNPPNLENVISRPRPVREEKEREVKENPSNYLVPSIARRPERQAIPEHIRASRPPPRPLPPAQPTPKPSAQPAAQLPKQTLSDLQPAAQLPAAQLPAAQLPAAQPAAQLPAAQPAAQPPVINMRPERRALPSSYDALTQKTDKGLNDLIKTLDSISNDSFKAPEEKKEKKDLPPPKYPLKQRKPVGRTNVLPEQFKEPNKDFIERANKEIKEEKQKMEIPKKYRTMEEAKELLIKQDRLKDITEGIKKITLRPEQKKVQQVAPAPSPEQKKKRGRPFGSKKK